MNVARLNQLRVKMRAAWASGAEAPAPLILLRGQGTDPEVEPLSHSARTIASELGLRFVDLDLTDGLSDECLKKLERPGPRLVLVRGLGLDPPAGLEAAIRAKARSLILVDAVLAGEAAEPETDSATLLPAA